jgi:hypothetical protein
MPFVVALSLWLSISTNENSQQSVWFILRCRLGIPSPTAEICMNMQSFANYGSSAFREMERIKEKSSNFFPGFALRPLRPFHGVNLRPQYGGMTKWFEL